MTRLVGAELLKLRTTGGVWAFLLAIAGITAVSVAGQVGTTPDDVLAQEESLEDLLAAAGVSSLFALLAGVVAFTTEFRHGTIAQTFLVTPGRERVLAAKVATFALVGAAFGLVATGVVLAMALPWLSARGVDLAVADRDRVLILVGAVASAALWGPLGVAVGGVVRNQVLGVVAVLVWVLVIENLMGALAEEVAPYLPGRASGAIVGSEFLDDDLSRAGGTLVTLAYVAAFSALAAVTLRRRDVD